MKGFYGWRMVGAGAGLQFLQAGLLHQAFGAYFAVLTEERGWSKTALSGASAMQSMEAAVIGPLLGWIIDRFGPQGMIRAGVLAFGLGFMALSQIDTLAGFYGAVAIIAIGSSLCGYFPINVAIIHWFEKRRARALSMVSLGLALGGVFVPLVAWSIHTFGWRVTAFASGVLAIAVGLPMARVFKHHPEDVGQRIDGLPPPDPTPSAPLSAGAGAAGASPAAAPSVGALAADAPSAGAPSAGTPSAGAPTGAPAVPAVASGPRDFTAREALRTSAFWLLALGHAFALLVVLSVNVHAITHISRGLGYTVPQASLVIMLMTIAQVGGVLLGGAIGDRYDKRHISAACMLMHGAGLLMLTYAVSPWMLAAFALLHGSAWGLRGPMMQAIRADFFGRRSIGMILGLSSTVVVIGQIGGPLIAGAFADLTGDYRMGFTVLGVLCAFGSLLFVYARRPT
ncbi:MAG TPA: MFS transporter [Quisquiliibacterium sp.]|nr:MFS transporter [Quisquiliibacterium sp.]